MPAGPEREEMLKKVRRAVVVSQMEDLAVRRRLPPMASE